MEGIQEEQHGTSSPLSSLPEPNVSSPPPPISSLSLTLSLSPSHSHSKSHSHSNSHSSSPPPSTKQTDNNHATDTLNPPTSPTIMAQATSPKQKKIIVRGRKATKWTPETLVTDSKSPLGDADLRGILLNPDAWDVLDAAEKEEILAHFPDGEHVLDAGTDRARPNLQLLMSDDTFRHDCAQYTENLRSGHYEQEWLEVAWAAHERRKMGDFDQFLDNKFEDDWQVDLPESLRARRPAVPTPSINPLGNGPDDANKNGNSDSNKPVADTVQHPASPSSTKRKTPPMEPPIDEVDELASSEDMDVSDKRSLEDQASPRKRQKSAAPVARPVKGAKNKESHPKAKRTTAKPPKPSPEESASKSASPSDGGAKGDGKTASSRKRKNTAPGHHVEQSSATPDDGSSEEGTTSPPKKQKASPKAPSKKPRAPKKPTKQTTGKNGLLQSSNETTDQESPKQAVVDELQEDHGKGKKAKKPAQTVKKVVKKSTPAKKPQRATKKDKVDKADQLDSEDELA